jgi:hypothetical protein
MAHEEDGGPPRKGKLSAFALLKSWLFDRRGPEPAHAETEFLNTRDGYELAKFAKKAFGGDAEAQRAQQAAVDAEQAEIDALLQGTGAIPMPLPTAAPVAAVGAAPAASPAPPPEPAAAPAPPAAAPARSLLDQAVKALDELHARGLSVEILAEALIIIESREVRERAKAGH